MGALLSENMLLTRYTWFAYSVASSAKMNAAAYLDRSLQLPCS